MRSRNDMPLVAETLAALQRQTVAHQLLVLDNDSTDGTVEEARKYTEHVFTVPKGEYVPGRVLNHAMAATAGEIVVFLNSDCTPADDRWLEELLNGFRDATGQNDPAIAAVFGRQRPRPNCRPLFAKDIEDTYGDGTRQRHWRHCFSMASSAVRRSAWQRKAFDETLLYSEDIDWTYRVRQSGQRIHYVPDSVVYHSHNYTLKQYYWRQYGEGMAEAFILPWSRWQRSFLRYSLLPYGRQVLSDARYCLGHGAVLAMFSSPVLRLAQLLGRRAGFSEGWKERGE